MNSWTVKICVLPSWIQGKCFFIVKAFYFCDWLFIFGNSFHAISYEDFTEEETRSAKSHSKGFSRQHISESVYHWGFHGCHGFAGCCWRTRLQRQLRRHGWKWEICLRQFEFDKKNQTHRTWPVDAYVDNLTIKKFKKKIKKIYALLHGVHGHSQLLSSFGFDSGTLASTSW